MHLKCQSVNYDVNVGHSNCTIRMKKLEGRITVLLFWVVFMVNGANRFYGQWCYSLLSSRLTALVSDNNNNKLINNNSYEALFSTQS